MIYVPLKFGELLQISKMYFCAQKHFSKPSEVGFWEFENIKRSEFKSGLSVAKTLLAPSNNGCISF